MKDTPINYLYFFPISVYIYLIVATDEQFAQQTMEHLMCDSAGMERKLNKYIHLYEI